MKAREFWITQNMVTRRLDVFGHSLLELKPNDLLYHVREVTEPDLLAEAIKVIGKIKEHAKREAFGEDDMGEPLYRYVDKVTSNFLAKVKGE